MKINCIHGYFKFSETREGQISRFMSRYGLEIERSGDHLTFKALVDAPSYSIAGGTFLGAPTLKTYAGNPWDVMRENNLVYDFNLGLVVPIIAIVRPIKIQPAGSVYISNGMIQPGSITDDGQRVTDYWAHFNSDTLNFRYSQISFGVLL